MECSGCGRWVKAGDVDVAGLPVSEVAEMDVFCLRCVYLRLAESRRAWQESQDENKALREMILILSDEIRNCVARISDPPGGVSASPIDARLLRVPAEQLQGNFSIVESPFFADVVAASARNNNEMQGTPEQQRMNKESQEGEDRSAFTTVRRRKKKSRPTINVIGDSMVRNITKSVKCGEESSRCISLRGAGVKQVYNKACETLFTMRRDGLLVLSAGGNSLRALGPEEIARSITNAVKRMTEERKDVKIAVVSVLPRPKESKDYETMRIATNHSIQSQLCMMKAKFVQQRAGDVSFLDLDRVLPLVCLPDIV